MAHRHIFATFTVLVAIGTAACGGSDNDGRGTSSTSATNGTSLAASTTQPAVTTTSAAPTTFREAVIRRWSAETNAAFAEQLWAKLSAEIIDAFESKIGVADAGSDPSLGLVPPTAQVSEFDSLIVFAFGNRVAPNGALSAGPVNEALADVTQAMVKRHAVPVYAQWEVADLLIARGVANVISIGREIAPDGTVTYLSTAGVAAKAVTLAQDRSTALGHVGVVGFADHATRCVLTARQAGMRADAPSDVNLPSEYDDQSGQPWTRDRLTYLATDFAGRVLLLQR